MVRLCCWGDMQELMGSVLDEYSCSIGGAVGRAIELSAEDAGGGPVSSGIVWTVVSLSVSGGVCACLFPNSPSTIPIRSSAYIAATPVNTHAIMVCADVCAEKVADSGMRTQPLLPRNLSVAAMKYAIIVPPDMSSHSGHSLPIVRIPSPINCAATNHPHMQAYTTKSKVCVMETPFLVAMFMPLYTGSLVFLAS